MSPGSETARGDSRSGRSGGFWDHPVDPSAHFSVKRTTTTPLLQFPHEKSLLPAGRGAENSDRSNCTSRSEAGDANSDPRLNAARIPASHFAGILRAGEVSRDGPGLSPARQVAAPDAAMFACVDGTFGRQAGSLARESSEDRVNP